MTPFRLCRGRHVTTKPRRDQARQTAAVNALEETRVRIRDAQRELHRQADLLLGEALVAALGDCDPL